ncbi:MAG: hypothetical protein ACOYN4_04845 [Bacteroidales bacterium]
MKTNLDNQIDNLKPGQSIETSKGNGIVCSVERSGNGKLLRFVRTEKNGSFEVYKTVILSK